jgi:hypothetical protein
MFIRGLISDQSNRKYSFLGELHFSWSQHVSSAMRLCLNTKAIDAAYNEMNSISDREAAYIGKVLEEPYFTASSTASGLAGIREKNKHFSRADVISLLYGSFGSTAL